MWFEIKLIVWWNQMQFESKLIVWWNQMCFESKLIIWCNQMWFEKKWSFDEIKIWFKVHGIRQHDERRLQRNVVKWAKKIKLGRIPVRRWSTQSHLQACSRFSCHKKWRFLRLKNLNCDRVLDKGNSLFCNHSTLSQVQFCSAVFPDAVLCKMFLENKKEDVSVTKFGNYP